MRQRRTIMGPYAMRPIEMLLSPAMRVLSLSARRVLDRVEIEYAQHGGKDNGQLPVTHADFLEHGIDHNAIGSALREVVALEFLEQTRRGFAGPTEHCPSLFRLTYRATDQGEPTDEWRNIGTIEEAEARAQEARASKPKRELSFNQRRKKFRVILKTRSEPDPENQDQNLLLKTRSSRRNS
jgi:hypothetical protein